MTRTGPSRHDGSAAPELPDAADIRFHDTTVRDGEQRHGVEFTEDETVALALDEFVSIDPDVMGKD